MTYIMQPYDDALQYVLDHGIRKSNRTGIDTISLFGLQTRYKIDTNFPILTKRKMFPRSIFAELLWMLSGSTNVNDLEAMGSKIWSPWRDPEFEKANGYNDGELGPIYGWQLRHFGGNYEKRESSVIPNENGFDQISYVVNELKTNRYSRRILFTYWNPPDVTGSKVRLPPCHHTFMLSVDDQNRLSGMLFQRSCDLPVGGPCNVQFYSALIYMLAQQCSTDEVKLTPYEFIHSTADTHIYVNQIDAVKEYLARPQTDSPKLNLKKANSIFNYILSDFEVTDYNPQDKITMPIAV